MERSDERSSPLSLSPEETVRLALDAIHDLKAAGVDPTLARKLDEAAEALAGTRPASPERQRRVFGAFAGQFTIGPEFFEPMSETDLRNWSAD